MTEVWQPLSEREAGSARGLREGLPAGLVMPLRGWIYSEADAAMSKRVLLMLNLEPFDDPFTQTDDLTAFAFWTPARHLLDMADAVLDLLARQIVRGRVEPDHIRALRAARFSLQGLLNDARSVYQVKSDGSGLERRVDPIASHLLDSAAEVAAQTPEAGSASEHLREASDAVRDLHPNAKHAYRMAIAGVESAAHAVIEPTNKKATLGTMLRGFEDNAEDFEAEIAGPDRNKAAIAPVAALMRMLWSGQTSRHGSKEPTRVETPEEAEMAVQLASLLVLWFTTGMVRRKSGP